MIEFNGELSKKVSNFILKTRRKSDFKIMIICLLVFIYLPSLFFLNALWQHIICLLFCLLLTSLTLIPIPKSQYNKMFPSKVIIDKEGCITCESEEFNYVRYVAQVEIVEDYGDFYMIQFYYPFESPYFICDKSLLTKGTIEEFEEIFKEVLVEKS